MKLICDEKYLTIYEYDVVYNVSKGFDNKGKSQTVVDFHHVIEVRQLSVLPVLSSI